MGGLHLKIHTVGITGSQQTKPGEEPAAQFLHVVEINGVLHDQFVRSRVITGADEFQQVLLRAAPSSIETVAHDHKSWDRLIKRMEGQ